MGGKYGNGQGQNNPQEMLAEAQILLVAGIPTSPLDEMITDWAIISFRNDRNHPLGHFLLPILECFQL